MEFKDYYKIMGVSRDASQEDIKRAYRKLARKYHPDVSKERNAEERFKELNRVYFGMRSFSSLGSSASLTQRRSATSQGLALMPCRNISTRSMSSAVLVWQ